MAQLVGRRKPHSKPRGKSASAPGHNKPAGQKNAVGRGETWQQVAKNNKIKDPRKLQIGQKVKVDGKTVSIKKGDTLYGLTRGSRGKSAAAPGHNKPAGQKNAIGRGKTKRPMKPADGSLTGPRGTGRPRPGPTPVPVIGSRPVSPKPVDPGMGIIREQTQPVAGRQKPIGGDITAGGHYGFHDPIGPIKRSSPNPGVVPQKQAAGSTTRYQTFKGATGIARAKQTPAGTRAQGVPFRASTAPPTAARTKPKPMGRKLPG